MAGPSSHLTKITVNCGDNDNGHTGHHPWHWHCAVSSDRASPVCSVQVRQEARWPLSPDCCSTWASSHTTPSKHWLIVMLCSVLKKLFNEWHNALHYTKFSTPTCIIGNGHWWHDCQDWWKRMHKCGKGAVWCGYLPVLVLFCSRPWFRVNFAL